MIACYRRISHIILKNTRTLFCDVPKAAPRCNVSWHENIEKTLKTGTTTNGHQYDMCHVRNNFRVLRIVDPEIIKTKDVFISFRIGVGSEEDPPNCKGRAHLLEHVVLNLCFDLDIPYKGETLPFSTIFTLVLTTKDYQRKIREFSRVLFSQIDLHEFPKFRASVKMERDRVDNEFEETRHIYGSHHCRTIEILKLKGMELLKFRNGTRETFNEMEEVDVLTTVAQFRNRYRESPLDVVLYSGRELSNMGTFLQLLNVEDFLQKGEATEVHPFDWKKSHESQEFSNRLIVLDSDDDWKILQIMFPLNKKLNRKHTNTFRLLCEMMECTSEGSLSHYLLENNLATQCISVDDRNTFIVSVHLTNEGLSQIQKVEKAVQNYLRFLHKKWTKLGEFQYRESSAEKALDDFNSMSVMMRTDFVGSFVDLTNDKFDYADLFEPFDQEEEKKFLSEQILDNKNIVRTIISRDPYQVFHALTMNYEQFFPSLIDLTNMDHETELIYGSKFYIIETQLFKADVKVSIPFKLQDFRNLKRIDEKLSFNVFIVEPKDAAYQSLYVTNSNLHFRRFWSPYNRGLFYAEPNKTSFYPAFTSDYEFYRDWPISINERHFEQSRTHLMCELVEKMSNSEQFALSLMRTAVVNVNSVRKGDPIPMQYETLRKMKKARIYNNYAIKIGQLDFENEILKEPNEVNKIPFKAECFIKSINKNEVTTATFLFCQTHQSEDTDSEELLRRCIANCLFQLRPAFEYYTQYCAILSFGGYRGILIQILSAENKKSHGFSRDKMYAILRKYVPHKMKATASYTPNVEKLHREMMERTIMIQVIGHTKRRDNEAKFDKQFEKWYKKNVKKLKKIVALPVEE